MEDGDEPVQARAGSGEGMVSRKSAPSDRGAASKALRGMTRHAHRRWCALTIRRRWSCRRGHLEIPNEPQPGQIPWPDPPIRSPLGATHPSPRRRLRGIFCVPLGFASAPKNSLSTASRWARQPETFPKTAIHCHVLPFCSRKIALPVAVVLFLLATRGHAGQPGPRAEKRERGQDRGR
jgi:hypothetical protein